MGLSHIEFSDAEMREMEEAAAKSFRHGPLEKAVRLPKGIDPTTLKRMIEQASPDSVAVILGITVEQLRSMVK